MIFSDRKTELTLVTEDYSCTESVQILRCHLLYLTIYLVEVIFSDPPFKPLSILRISEIIFNFLYKIDL